MQAIMSCVTAWFRPSPVLHQKGLSQAVILAPSYGQPAGSGKGD